MKILNNEVDKLKIKSEEEIIFKKWALADEILSIRFVIIKSSNQKQLLLFSTECLIILKKQYVKKEF